MDSEVFTTQDASVEYHRLFGAPPLRGVMSLRKAAGGSAKGAPAFS